MNARVWQGPTPSGRARALLVLAVLVAPGCSDTLSPLVAPPAFAAVTAGGHHSCALTDQGVAYCWGRGQDGELGNGATENSLFPVQVSGGKTFTDITAGDSHTCALASGGAAWCWGWNAFYQRGNPTDPTPAAPVAVAGGHLFKSIDAGEQHTCALTPAGQTFCWGYNRYGQLGNGTLNTSVGPEPVAGGLTFTLLSAGARHTCALTGDGTAYCWGDNAHGQLGIGSDSLFAPAPRRVAGSLHFTSVSAGEDHTCALAASKAYCWGANPFGQLGTGAAAREGLPGTSTPVASATNFSFSSIRAGYGVTCGVDAGTGYGYCWGRGLYGQLGIGIGTDQYFPQTIHLQPGQQFTSDLLRFTDVGAAGLTHTCGLSADHAVYCWGTGFMGELGSGRISYSPVPVLVQMPH